MQQEVQRTGYEDLLASGVVITGGATMLEGMADCRGHSGLACGLGAPTKVGGLVDVVRSPQFATGVGLVLYGRENEAVKLLQGLESECLPKLKQGFKTCLAAYFE